MQQLVNLTPIQNQYYNDFHRFSIISAGRRSRKTLIGRRKILLAALQNPNHKYFHGAPTRQQAKDIFWDNLKRDTKGIIKRISETELKIILLNNTEISVVGLDKPERIEGQTPSWNGCHITEFANLKEQAFKNHIYPALSDEKGFGIFDGVPEGRNHYYELALKASGGALPTVKSQIGGYAESGDWSFFGWFSSDVLDDDIIQAAKEDLDEKTYRQEYEGSFESYQGLAYYTFGQHNIDSSVVRKPGLRIAIGMDFNVNPMTATLGHLIGRQYLQFDELYMTASNTFEMRDAIKEQFNPISVDIFPDATGDNNESNAAKSDLDILRQSGFSVHAKRSNPYEKDRVNAVNSFIKNDKQVRYLVNPKCKNTINDLNKVERLDDGRLNKKQEGSGLKHISDALGYLIYYNFPLKDRIKWL